MAVDTKSLGGVRNYVYDVVEELGDDDSRIFELCILTLITLNIIALILQTVDWIYQPNKVFFHYFDLISVGIFTVELAVRLWACTANEKYKHPIWGRVRYLFTTMALIDLLAILPFYLPFFMSGVGDLRHLRAARLFRFFKVIRYSRTLRLLQRVVWDRREELFMSTLFLLVLLLFSASLMYYAEHAAQPEDFASIPAAMWWAVATLTTVGYGDVFPVTTFGRTLASVIAILGIGMFALPTGILGAAFMEEVEAEKLAKRKLKEGAETEEAYPYSFCPHCGENLPEATS